MDPGVDGRWMTYSELAELRRIDKASALKLALRQRWPRRKNNHGRMQVCVPLDWAQPPERRHRDAGMEHGRDRGMDLSTALATLERAKATMENAAARLKENFEEAMTAKDQAITALTARADTAEAARQRAQQTADQLRVELGQAQAQVEAIRQAEAARKAASRWSRLRSAWRGE